jgi:hypothetical protein
MGNNGEVHEEEEDLHGENQSDRNEKKYCPGSFNEDMRKRRLTRVQISKNKGYRITGLQKTLLRHLYPTNGQTSCTFKWSDGRTVETIGAAPPL